MKEHDPQEIEHREAATEARRVRAGKNASGGKNPAAIEAGRRVGQARPDSAQMMNRLLADHFTLYVRTLNYHWNVRGMQFHSLHTFLEELYKKQFAQVDDIAERVRTLGEFAFGSMDQFLKHAKLKEESSGEPPDPRTMLANLAMDYEAILRTLHEDIRAVEERYDDPGTCNFLTDLLEEHEKTVWMLQVHLDLDLG